MVKAEKYATPPQVASSSKKFSDRMDRHLAAELLLSVSPVLHPMPSSAHSKRGLRTETYDPLANLASLASLEASKSNEIKTEKSEKLAKEARVLQSIKQEKMQVCVAICGNGK